MAAVMVLQSAIFSGTILWGGTIERLDRNAFDILNERVINRKNYIQNEMLGRWSSISGYDDAIGRKAANLQSGDESEEELLDIAETLIYILRRNSVTGAFVILDGDGGRPSPGNSVQKTGLYFRNLDPVSSSANNDDLLAERAPAGVTKELGISLDTEWKPKFLFSADDSLADDFYYSPFDAGVANPGVDDKELGYWSAPFRLTETGVEMITYSQPLRDARGATLGVIGIELTLDYLRGLLPYDELAAGKTGSYMLGVKRSGDLEFEKVISTGPAYLRLMEEHKELRLDPQPAYGSGHELIGSRSPAYGCVQYIDLYNSNTPFEQDRWALVGVMERGDLLGFSDSVRGMVLIALAISMAIGAVGVMLAGTLMSKPITALVHKVRESDPRLPVKLQSINISEIDELSFAVEMLSGRVAESASRLSQILKITGMKIGAFEAEKDSGLVSYTEGFFDILALNVEENPTCVMPDSEFISIMRRLDGTLEEGNGVAGMQVVRVERTEGQPSWVRVQIVQSDATVLGVVNDITGEVLERSQLERERDYDILTDLLNRRAFARQLEELFDNPVELQVTALIMLDLDNLKYINDTYGHDYGDSYIRRTAEVLKRCDSRHTIVSRMAGDEFHVLFHGFPDRDGIRKAIARLREDMDSTSLSLPDGSRTKVRASAGVAWYPDDSGSYAELMKYADFAMYKVKRTTKGEFEEFDRGSYDRESFLLRDKEELNRLIDGRMVDYHFQPIVSADTGEIFAYEALMRSRVAALKSPFEVLAMARSESKLYQIERLTWFEAMYSFRQFSDIPETVRVFINSIANQVMSPADIAEFEREFEEWLPRIVIELTEEEKPTEQFVAVKKECARRWGAAVALDDYGSGYSGDGVLLALSPRYVKLDMSIVRGIDTDSDRRKILTNMVSYASGRRIKVIAEGVETRGELETLIKSGVDYLQGYYIGMPSSTPQPVSPEISSEIALLHRGKVKPSRRLNEV